MLNESPHAHSCLAWGFTIVRPPPSIESLNSSVEPVRIGALAGSISTRNPPGPSITWSSPEAWSRIGVASDNPVTVRALAYIIAGHVAHHTNVLREKYL